MAKQIKLKIEKVEINDKLEDFDYAKTIKSILSSPGVQGLSMEEVDQSLKIMDKIKLNGNPVQDNIRLEDADWEYLKKRLKECRWSTPHHGIKNLRDAVNNAEDIKI